MIYMIFLSVCLTHQSAVAQWHRPAVAVRVDIKRIGLLLKDKKVFACYIIFSFQSWCDAPVE